MTRRRNLFAITGACFIGFAGFTLVMPFLPLYFQQLGVTDVAAVARWSGVSLGVTPAITAVLAPFWGRLADRFGRKIMIERSLVAFVILMAAMAFATEAWHVLAIRAAQGLFAGYGALALTMAADSAPRHRVAESIGYVQTAQRLGPAVGPVIGGLVARAVGLRHAFMLTAGFYVIALGLVFVMYDERPFVHRTEQGRAGRVSFRDVLTFENFALLLVLVFGLQFVDRSFGPILPLYVAALGTPGPRVPMVSGLVFSLAAATGAVGHHACGMLLRRRTAREVIGGALATAAVAATVCLGARGSWVLLAATPFFGLSIGVATTAAYTAASAVIPGGARGAGFGFLAIASLCGLAVSPMVSGLLAATSIRAVFLADVIALVLMAMAVRGMAATPLPAGPARPAADEL